MSTTLRTAAVAVISMAAVLAPSAAFAKAATIDDATGDVWEVTSNEQEEAVYSEDGSIANVDVDRSVVSHADKRISVKVKFHVLKKNNTYPNIRLLAQTDGGTEYYMYAYAFEEGDSGWQTGGFVGTTDHVSRGGTVCEGVKADIDFDKDVMTVSAPRACFGGPAWIKAHVSSNATRFAESGMTSWYDNGHNKSHAEHKPWTDRIKKG